MKRIAIFIIIILGLGFYIFKKSNVNPPKLVSFDESVCWVEDNSWSKVDECSRIRSDKFLAFATLEKSRNKINLIQSKNVNSFQRYYYSTKYNFAISYPEDWSVNLYNNEGIETISIEDLNSNASAKTQLIIGTGQAYSTSGSLCANQGCDYEAGKVVFNNGAIGFLTKSYIWVNDKNNVPIDTKVENYRFSIPLSELLGIIENNNYVYVTASFHDEDAGNKILDILTTLK